MYIKALLYKIFTSFDTIELSINVHKAEYYFTTTTQASIVAIYY